MEVLSLLLFAVLFLLGLYYIILSAVRKAVIQALLFVEIEKEAKEKVK